MAIQELSMDRDVTTILPGIYETQAGWAAPLKIIAPRFILKDIGQTNPYPGQLNTLKVTLAWNVDLVPRVRRCKQRAFAGWRAGERGFDVLLAQESTHQQEFPEIAVADRDTQRAGGGSGLPYSKVCSARRDMQFGTKKVPGTPCASDADCRNDDGFQNSYCVETSCHAEEWVRPNVTIQNLAGMAQLSGMRVLYDFLGNGSTRVFGGQNTGASGDCFSGATLVSHAAEWCRALSQLRLSVIDSTVAGVPYTFELSLRNALLAQNSPLVEVRLNGGLHAAVVPMDKDVTRVLDTPGAVAGDAAPGEIYAIKFSYARIGQATAHPFAVNTITMTIATNLALQMGSRIGISPFLGSSMSGIDDFDSARSLVTLRGPNASFFSAWVESTDYKHCGNFVPTLNRETGKMTICPYLATANFDATTKTFAVYNAREIVADSSLTFSFKLRNPGVAQESPEMGISIQISDQDFPRAAIIRAGGEQAPLKVSGALLRTKRIGQSVPYPSALNDIGVTISFNVPIPKAAQARITISGLLGAVPDGGYSDPGGASSLLDMQDVSDLEQCSGLSRAATPGWLGCNAFGIKADPAASEHTRCAARWDLVTSELALEILEDLAADTEYAFLFTLRNPPREQLPASPGIQVQGYVPILPKQAMDVDASSNLQDIHASVTECATCEDALPRWYRWSGRWGGEAMPTMNVGLFPSRANQAYALPLKILRGSFLNVLDGRVRECGPGEPCGGWAWQSDPNPGAPYNIVTIQFGVSVPLLASSGASIHVKGLRNAIKDEGIYPLAAPAEQGDIEISQGEMFVACSSTPLKVSGGPGGPDDTWSWVQQDESANFYLKSDLNPGIWYYLHISLKNPMVPQESPAEGANPSLILQVRGTAADAFENRLVNRQNKLKALEIAGPRFVVKSIAQETALPSANNRIIVTIATNVPLREGTCIRLSGFNDGEALINPEPKEIRLPYVNTTYSGLPWQQVAPTTQDAAGGAQLGHGLWDGDMLQFCLRTATVQLVEYVFSIQLQNPGQAQQSKQIAIQALSGLRIPSVDMDADSSDEGRREPLRILQMRFIVSKIGQSSRFPGARNTITLTLAVRLPLYTEMLPDFTVTGLTGSRPDPAWPDPTKALLPLTCVKGCIADCTRIQCSRGYPLYGECCGEAGVGGGEQLISGTPCALEGRPCTPVTGTCVGPISVSNPGECCDTSIFSPENLPGSGNAAGYANWNYQTGTLSMRAMRDVAAERNYTFSFEIENSVDKQAARQVSIATSAAGSLLIPPGLMKADASFPPMEVDEVGFLLLAAKQSSAYPCQENTITVTLALNVPVRKGLRIVLEGLTGAQFGTPEGNMWTELDILDVPDPALRAIIGFNDGLHRNVSEIFNYKLYKIVENGQEKFWMEVQDAGLAESVELVPAGIPFAFQYKVFNPRNGQAAPLTFRARGYNARVGLNSDFALRELSPVRNTLHESSSQSLVTSIQYATTGNYLSVISNKS